MESASQGASFYIIVPVLNEAENLENLFAAFRALETELAHELNLDICFILVDDGSTDNTGQLAGQLAAGLNFILLTHEKNLGPGRAFATAFEYIASRLKDTDWVATMEGDNTSRHELIRQMFLRTREGYEVILASPYMYGGGIANTTPWRMFLSHFANAFIKEFLGIHGILTMSSFFRLYSGAVIKKLQVKYGPRILERAGFESMIELLFKMIYLNISISEVPMLLDTSIRKGKSKMKIPKTIWGYLMLFKDKKRWC